MKTLKNILLLVLAACLIAACAKKQTSSEEPYNRGGGNRDTESLLRNKVFAPYSGEGKFYAVYALATLTEGRDDKGFYTVKFFNGPDEGKKIKTKDVIFKTSAVGAEELRKGDVVLLGNANRDVWRKAVIYDERQSADGRVVIEFPHDRNDFLATRETVLPAQVRVIREPAVRDPRNFIL